MKKRLFTPGPTPLPEEVRLAQAKEIIHHRGKEFSTIFEEVCQGLKDVLQTENDVLVLTASGTGAMEAAVVNLLSPQDEVLVVRGGKFGERWAEIGNSFGIKVTCLDVKWGTVVDPQLIKESLARNPKIKAVFTQLTETSTGVVYDIKNIAKVVSKTDAVLVVDAISGLGAEELFTDEWGVDVVIGGSQKALMIPPGLAFVSLSERAWKLVERSTLPKYYWDFKKAKKSLSKLQTPYTPAVSLICALKESLRLIKKEGWQNLVQRYHRLAEATRKGVLALGLEIFSQVPSNVVTAVKMPPGIDADELRQTMRNKYGIEVAGGQGELAGKIIRIAHLGWMDSLDVIVVISALEMALLEWGYSLELGKGVKAAEEILGEIR